MHEAGIDATQCDLTDFEAVQSALDDIGNVGAMTLLDVIEHLTQPQRAALRPVGVVAEARRAPLVVSVPNVAHFDLGLRLLCGRWIPSDTGLLDSTHLRFFTEKTLAAHARALRVAGGRPRQLSAHSHRPVRRRAQRRAAGRDDRRAACPVRDVQPQQASVQQFVWALKPVPIGRPSRPPTSRPSGAKTCRGDHDEFEPTVDTRPSVPTSLRSGLMASENNRRACPTSSVVPGSSLPLVEAGGPQEGLQVPALGAGVPEGLPAAALSRP